jgi:hypothetical protein
LTARAAAAPLGARLSADDIAIIFVASIAHLGRNAKPSIYTVNFHYIIFFGRAFRYSITPVDTGGLH